MQPAVRMKLRRMGNGRMPVEIIRSGANDVRPGNEMARNQIGIVQSTVAAAYGDVGLIVLQVVQSIAEIKDRTDFGKLGLQSRKGRLKSAGFDDRRSQGNPQFADGFCFQIVDNGTRIGQGSGEAATVFTQGTAGERLRVLRFNSLMPCRVSRRLMCWLTADGVMPSAAAAAFMLPCSRTAAKTSRGLMSCISTDYVVQLHNHNSKTGIIKRFRRPYNALI